MSEQSPSQHQNRSEQLSACGDKEMPLSEDRGSNKVGSYSGQAMAASELNSETRRSNKVDENVSITHMPRGSMTI